MDRPFIPTRRRGRPSVGRPSNAELARRLNAARLQFSRERAKLAKEESDEQALRARVPDPDEKLSFEEWQALPPELFQLQLDYLDCRDLKLPLFVPGESPEERSARVFEAILKFDGIDYEQAMERVATWEREREAKAKLTRPLPTSPDRELPLAEEDLPVPVALRLETNPSGVPTPTQLVQAEADREMEFERQRLYEFNRRKILEEE